MSAHQGKELAKQILELKTEKQEATTVVFTNPNEENAYNAITKAQKAILLAQNAIIQLSGGQNDQQATLLAQKALIQASNSLKDAKTSLEEDKYEYEPETWLAGV